MKKLFFVFLLAACASYVCLAHDETFQVLNPADCVDISSTTLKNALPSDWQPFISATKACALAPQQKPQPSVWLVSVFADVYYQNKPASAPWENFPQTMLVDNHGDCLAQLPELYPHDQPRALELRYGDWVGAIPQKIHVHVKNPAMGGDYDLPSLIWNAKDKLYRSGTDHHPSKESTTCKSISAPPSD